VRTNRNKLTTSKTINPPVITLSLSHLVRLPSISASLDQCFHCELVAVNSSKHKRRPVILSHSTEGRRKKGLSASLRMKNENATGTTPTSKTINPPAIALPTLSHHVHLRNVSASLDQCFHCELVTVVSSKHKRRPAILLHREEGEGVVKTYHAN
jgi:hypothetical protein